MRVHCWVLRSDNASRGPRGRKSTCGRVSCQRSCWGLALGLASPASADAQAADRPLEIYFIDVMGGAATLLVTPERESILIDSGWPGSGDRDPARIVQVLKERAGCEQLDHLVTTHWHRDHFGGVAGLAKLVQIAHFWDRGLPEEHEPGLDFPDGPAANDALGVAYRMASQGKRKALKPGDSLPIKGLNSLVLASGGKVVDRRTVARATGRPASESTNSLCEQAPPTCLSTSPTTPAAWRFSSGSASSSSSTRAT